MIIAQYTSSQVAPNPEMDINDAIKIQVAVLDSLHLIPAIESNSIALSLKKESDNLKKYLDSLTNYAEIELDTSKYYTIDSAWQLKFGETNLEQELSKYIKQIRNLPIEEAEIEKISNYIDRKSKFKPFIQDSKEIIETFIKKSIISIFKMQYIDIVNAEIFFLENTILNK